MRVIVPDYYENFKCIASECTDTCCAGWEVDVDENAQEFYQTVQGSFGRRLKENTIIDEEGIRFTLTDKKRCCFLNDCNLCDLYTELGEEHLCATCADFPRFSEAFGDLREKGISLSCPTAAGLILNHDARLSFKETKADEMVAINDIDYDLYMQLVAARKQTFEILWNRERDIIWRIIAVLLFANDIQKYIYKGKYKKIARVREKYLDEKYIDKKILKAGEKALRHVDGVCNTRNILSLFEEFEVINDIWPQELKSAKEVNAEILNNDGEYAAYFKSRKVQYEQLMVYFIYRYFMKAVYDLDLIAKVKLGVISIIVIRSVEKSQWRKKKALSLEEFIETAHLYSKEIEHSDENMEGISVLCHEDLCFHAESLIASLL